MSPRSVFCWANSEIILPSDWRIFCSNPDLKQNPSPPDQQFAFASLPDVVS